MSETTQGNSASDSTIVVGIDFSVPSHHAIEAAVRLARLEEARLVICHFLYENQTLTPASRS